MLEGNAQAARQQIGYGVDVDTVDDEGSPLVVLVRMDIEPYAQAEAEAKALNPNPKPSPNPKPKPDQVRADGHMQA